MKHPFQLGGISPGDDSTLWATTETRAQNDVFGGGATDGEELSSPEEEEEEDDEEPPAAEGDELRRALSAREM